MKILKKFFSIILSLTVLSGAAVTIGRNRIAEIFITNASADETAYAVGDIIEYGTYPQSKVTDENIIAALNNCDGEWKNCNYYSGTGTWDDGLMAASDYMRYKDVVYGGSKYRGVIFDTYRPSYTGYESTTGLTKQYQQENGYTCGNVYWFKYEPIRWRVLDAAEGLVMCDTIIDSQACNNYIISDGTDEYGNTAYFGDSSKTYYLNNYEKSSIREWLNDSFYNTAFSSEQKANILTTTIDNSAYSADYPAYNSASTSDKIYLLSSDDAMNESYGFKPSCSIYDTARQLKGSDYAKSQGLYVYHPKSGSSCDGCSYWRMRSPGNDSDSSALVSIFGSIYYHYNSNFTGYGVVPALNLQNLKSDISYSETAFSCGDGTHTVYDSSLNAKTEKCTYTSSSTATCTEAGTITYTCSVCGYTYTGTASAAGHIDADMNGYCDNCGTLLDADLAYPCRNAEINAVGGSVEYKTKVNLRATATGVPEGYCLAIYEGDTLKVKGSNTSIEYSIGRFTSGRTYTVKVIDADGNVQTDENGNALQKDVTISVNTSFFAKIIAFFKDLFGLLPEKTIGA